ncbi:MAG: GNAT family N-acetyltransferase [Paracoccaceae bacterium]
MVVIKRESPLGADLALLMERHTADMHAQTPPESIHMMDASALAVPEVAFFVMRDGETPVGMGAFKALDAQHGEIKSMHVLHEERGKGLSKLMLNHLVDAARGQGLTRLSLETGAEPIFAPARALYERAGFSYCAPFGDYTLDPNSVFMTKALA